MAKKVDIDVAKIEYEDHIKEFEKFEKAVIDQISVLINENDIKLATPIQSRIKAFASLSEKHESGRFTMKKSILELQDLIGFRILMLFKRDVESIVRLINDNFEILKEYNTDEKLSADQFGYSSKHLTIKIKDEWLKVPLYKNLGKYTGEIQIRTLSQHHWAETSNILQYKDKTSAPREILRSIGRVSALLEMVDLEYERLLNEREKYNEEIKTDYNKSEKLNVDTLKIVLDKNLPIKNRKDEEPYSELLKEILEFGIDTSEELEDLIVRRKDEVMIAEKEALKNNTVNPREDIGVYYSFAGLIRSVMRFEDAEKYAKIREKK
ncbi:RelA/SpoT domain-containing protein [Epilithonimonas sp. JDS]|uniref:GTP pyrophosphokinase n=1 Tax=Epilithonimonas sp. JDS TaxID=2902797 RepID=UPI001E59513E|nr:RelA/SpoT domain-containing protein [Epilithonimonas sp. JDS]MCD9855094.1 RelA/SpoT domain-containing protein [Epilithonimonas sp. JDS]